jgi:hypothetical protein
MNVTFQWRKALLGDAMNVTVQCGKAHGNDERDRHFHDGPPQSWATR